VPVLAKGKTMTGRLWTYLRDDQPFAGPEPPAAWRQFVSRGAWFVPIERLAGHRGGICDG
jgi:hypothetical protein